MTWLRGVKKTLWCYMGFVCWALV